MLMKLTPGVNFTNILCKAFTRADPQSAKKIDNLTEFLALLGSAFIKAACKMSPVKLFAFFVRPSKRIDNVSKNLKKKVKKGAKGRKRR